MAQEIVLPQWGMEMQDAIVVKWLKHEGDPVREGEPLVELETAKIATELESTASGVVAHILVPEGATVPIRTVLAIVAAPGEQVPRPAGAAPSVTVARAPASSAPGAPAASRHTGQVAPQVVPAARRLAQERGIDLSQVQGTGPGGRILTRRCAASAGGSHCGSANTDRGGSPGDAGSPTPGTAAWDRHQERPGHWP